jgi:putative SOS response-associated peptidase YedK
MCGRYQRRSDKQRIAEAFDLGDIDGLYLELSPSYNIAPTTRQPVIVANRETGNRSLAIMRWGLIPFWCKDLKKLGLSTINAKAEGLMEKPMWKGPFTKRRCLVPADGFYEWKALDAKTKQPYMFSLRSGEMFAFAGVWEHWKAPTGEGIDSYSIITTEPNELTATVHTRMPVILKTADYDRWLAPGDPQQPPIDLLRPYDAELMQAWPVHTDVGNVRNNRPDLCHPMNDGQKGTPA